MFLRSHSVCGMLIPSLTGNRIRGTPIFLSLSRREEVVYYIIHIFLSNVNDFSYIPYFFQVFGANKSNMGNISKRPASISKINTSFAKAEYPAKFPAGPTSPSPGPILFIVATTAVKLVIRSFPSTETNNRETTNTITKSLMGLVRNVRKTHLRIK